MSDAPRLSRRDFLAATTLALPGISMACAYRVRAGGRDARRVYVGTYTEGGRREGVYRFRLDSGSGALTPLGAIDAGPNPSFLALHPDGRALYAVNEIEDVPGARAPGGAVIALALDAAGNASPFGTRRASGGGSPCYVSVHPGRRHLLVANYGGGSVAVLPVAANGALGDATAVMRHHGSGPNRDRQERPHAHCAISDPSSRWVLATDLGIDRIMVYRLDESAGTLAPAPTPSAFTAPGAGPRHLAFHPNGRFLYVVNELDLTLGVYGWSADAGTLTPIATVPLLPGATSTSGMTAADLHVASSGRFLYASVRGDDSLAVFALDAATGTPAHVQHIATGGRWPRNFALDAAGGLLLVANQQSNDIVAFRVDPDTGRLTPTGARTEVPAPVCIVFG